MILLDTNVFSEPLKTNPEHRVTEWLNDQVIETIFLSSTSLAEILAGVEKIPNGKRKRALFDGVLELISLMIGPRVLAFDRQAAEAHAHLVAKANRKGVIVGFADAQIGAIAVVHGLTVASRDIVPFLAMEVPLINPWTFNNT